MICASRAEQLVGTVLWFIPLKHPIPNLFSLILSCDKKCPYWNISRIHRYSLQVKPCNLNHKRVHTNKHQRRHRINWCKKERKHILSCKADGTQTTMAAAKYLHLTPKLLHPEQVRHVWTNFWKKSSCFLSMHVASSCPVYVGLFYVSKYAPSIL